MIEPFRHLPVLLRETVEACLSLPTGRYLDVTGGGGGHAQELLNRLDPTAKVLIFDRDPQAITALNAKFATDPRVTVIQERFGNIRKVLEMLNWNQIDGVLADLGVSSPQLDSTDRGFSLSNLDAPLDLRMGLNQMTAAEWLAQVSSAEIVHALDVGGDFIHSHKIADPLHAAAIAGEVNTIREALQAGFGKVETLPGNVIARFLQSLRIALNDEYGELQALLECARDKLATGGKIAILTFHSGEAKIVKSEFAAHSPSLDPQRSRTGERYWSAVNTLPAKAVPGECRNNSRAASAVLRSAVRGGTR